MEKNELLREEAQVLKGNLELLAQKEAELKQKKKEFEESIKSLKEEVAFLKNTVEVDKGNIANTILPLYEETGETNYYGGFKVQQRTVKTYDEETAFNWAKEKQMFLTFDKKGFEKSAKSLGLDFYSESKVAQVTFPKEIKLED